MKTPTRIRELLTIDPGTGLKALVVVLGLALSAGIHLAVAYQHSTAGDHGRFFVTIGAAQAILAVVAFPGLALAALPQTHGAHFHHHGEEPIQRGGAAPTLSVFGDLFDDHHTAHKGDDARTAPGGD